MKVGIKFYIYITKSIYNIETLLYSFDILLKVRQ